jgi:hypothetical protein
VIIQTDLSEYILMQVKTMSIVGNNADLTSSLKNGPSAKEKAPISQGFLFLSGHSRTFKWGGVV